MAHPDLNSFNASLAKSYLEGIKKQKKHNYKYYNLVDLKFDFNFKKKQEKDLQKISKDIVWADLITCFYPTWWGNPPSLFQSFFERVFISGFAFKRKGKLIFGLLKNKKSRHIITMNTPSLIYKFFLGNLHKYRLRNTFYLCGIKPNKYHYFTPINGTSNDKKQKFLKEAFNLGGQE
jgi:putative NADPH-quinone reductase